MRSRSHTLQGAREFLALEHNIVVLLGATLVIGMGQHLWWRFMPKYLEALGAGTLAIGAYGSIRRLVSALYQYPGGWLADRLGRKRALLTFNIIATLGYLVFLTTKRWEWAVVGTLLVMAWTSMSLPAIFALIGDSLEQNKRAMGFSVQSIWKRLSVVIAPPVGGYLLAHWGIVPGMRLGFAIALLLAILAIFLQARFYRSPARNENDTETPLLHIWRLTPPGLRRLLWADCLVRFGAHIAAVYVVLWVVNIHQRTPLEFGGLVALQMLTAILGYLPAAYLADKWGRGPFILFTFVLFSIFPISLVILPAPFLFFAFILAGLREVGEPARKAFIVDLAEDHHRGRVIGLYYLIRGLVTIPAPLLGGLLWQHSPRWPFLVSGIIAALGALAYVGSFRMSAEPG